jgi:hypothetical protein
MKSTYSITLEGVLPVIAKLHIEADTESEAIMLAERVAECQRKGVKTTALAIEAYPADFLVFQGVADITPFAPGDTGQKIWNRDQIEAILEK